jgi:hypothetical protein
VTPISGSIGIIVELDDEEELTEEELTEEELTEEELTEEELTEEELTEEELTEEDEDGLKYKSLSSPLS